MTCITCDTDSQSDVVPKFRPHPGQLRRGDTRTPCMICNSSVAGFLVESPLSVRMSDCLDLEFTLPSGLPIQCQLSVTHVERGRFRAAVSRITSNQERDPVRLLRALADFHLAGL